MKSYVTYGLFIAIGNAVVTLVLYLTGFQSDPAKLVTGNYIATVVGLAIGIYLLVLGVRTKRESIPAAQEFTYGMALGAGVLISVFATLFGSAFQFIYQSFINPGFAEVIIQAQTAKFQAAGLPSDQIEKATQFMRMMTKPAVQAVTGFFAGMIFSVVISLVVAAFLRRKAVGPSLA